MDEISWLTGADPWGMLVFLRGQSYERKRRLFACACARLLWKYLDDERSRRAIEITEGFVDGKVKKKEIDEAFKAAWLAADWKNPADPKRIAVAACAGNWAFVAGGASITHKAVEMCHAPFMARKKRLEIENTQAALLREIFGNPFQIINIMPFWISWEDGLVLDLARNAYENPSLPGGMLENARLFTLAEALEKAGCSNHTILTHLRSVGPHYRGCWILDLLLTNEDEQPY